MNVSFSVHRDNEDVPEHHAREMRSFRLLSSSSQTRPDPSPPRVELSLCKIVKASCLALQHDA